MTRWGVRLSCTARGLANRIRVQRAQLGPVPWMQPGRGSEPGGAYPQGEAVVAALLRQAGILAMTGPYDKEQIILLPAQGRGGVSSGQMTSCDKE